MNKVFCIYPTDRQQSTSFLNRINTHLKRELAETWHCYKIKFTDIDHSQCIKKCIESKANFIIFMGHGKSDMLFGSCNSAYNEFISYEAVDVNENYYVNENFIGSENTKQFAGKIFFSFSCNSNINDSKSIGRNAILNGVKCFIGFGDVPTDYIQENNLPSKAISVFKGLIVKILKVCIGIAIKQNYSVQELIDFIKIETTKEIIILITKRKLRNKDKIIHYLFLFKNEITIFGDRHAKLIL